MGALAPMPGSTQMHFSLLNMQIPEEEVHCLNPFHSTLSGKPKFTEVNTKC